MQQLEGPAPDELRRLWGAWVAQHSGRVIASTAEALTPSSAEGEGAAGQAGGAPYTGETFEQATDVVLLPLGSFSALSAGLQAVADKPAPPEAGAAALAGAPRARHHLHSLLHRLRALALRHVASRPHCILRSMLHYRRSAVYAGPVCVHQ